MNATRRADDERTIRVTSVAIPRDARRSAPPYESDVRIRARASGGSAESPAAVEQDDVTCAIGPRPAIPTAMPPRFVEVLSHIRAQRPSHEPALREPPRVVDRVLATDTQRSAPVPWALRHALRPRAKRRDWMMASIVAGIWALAIALFAALALLVAS